MMAKAKKEFSWDSMTMVKEVKVSDYEKRLVTIATKNKKEFIVITTAKKIKDDWKPVKNATFPKDIWTDIVDAVTDLSLTEAFDVSPLTKVTKKEEPKLKGKKQENFDPATYGLPKADNIEYVDFPKILNIKVIGATRKNKTVKELEAMDKVVFMFTHKEKGKMVTHLEYRK